MTNAPKTLDKPALDRLHAAMAARVAERKLPGLVTAVATADEVHVDCIGETAFGSGRAMSRDAVFRLTSMTKPVLAASAMTLVDDDTLALDEPVDRLLPELADRRVLRRVDGPLDDTVPAERPITLEDLLTFRMGYGFHIAPGPVFDPPMPVTDAADEQQLMMGHPDPRTPHAPDEWMRRFGTLPLMHQPGELWQYNASSLVLGVLVARAAGQPLGDALRSRVFEPLGMTDTGFVATTEQASRMPAYHMTDFTTGELELHQESRPDLWTTEPAFPSGAAGLVGTLDDYLAFARCLLAGGTYQGTRILSEESVRLMTTNHLTPQQIEGGGVLLGGRGWGYGMAVSVTPDEVADTPGYYGWSGGYGTVWFNDPHRGVVCLALSQTSPFLWDGGADEFSRLAVQAAD